MSTNFKAGASLWDRIVISFGEVKDFATDKYGVSMVHIDGWFIGVILFFIIVPIAVYSGLDTSVTAEFTPVSRTVQKAVVLYDYPTFGEQKANSAVKQGKKIATIKKGAEIKLLGYSLYQGCYQVETFEGERGYISFDAIGDSLVALKGFNRENMRVKAGDILMLAGYKDNYHVSVKFDGNVSNDINLGMIRPVASLGLPTYLVSNYSPVTVRWLKSRFKKGETRKEDVDREWYGYALAKIVDGNNVTATYALRVQDAENGVVYDSFKVRYRDGIVDMVSYEDSKSMDWIMKKLPFVDAIQSSPLFVRSQAKKVTAPTDIKTVDDVKKEKSSAVAKWIKENVGTFNLPSWLGYIIGIVALIIMLLFALMFIHCVLLIVPAIVSFAGYIHVLPNGIYKIIMFLSLLFGGELLYVSAGGINWFLTILLVAYLYWQWIQWNYWINFNRCSNCGHLYTLGTTGYRDGGTSYYDKVDYRVKKYGNMEIECKETGRQHRKVVTVHEDLNCSYCGCDFSYTHESDMKA